MFIRFRFGDPSRRILRTQETAMLDSESGGKDAKDTKKEGRILTFNNEDPLPPIDETNFASYVLNIIKNYGNEVAVADSRTGKHHTYNDLKQLVPQLASGLVSAGVGKGDSVCLLTTNHIDYPIIMLAIIYAGACCVPASTSYSARELAHVIQISKLRWVVCHEDYTKRAEEAMALLDPRTIRKTWVIGESSTYPSIGTLMRRKVDVAHLEDIKIDPWKDVAQLPFSSGTTGLPKGVMLSHRNLVTAASQGRFLAYLGGDASKAMLQRCLLVVPVCHSYGHLTMINILLRGGLVVLMEKFSPEHYLESIQKYKITYAPVVPHIAKFLSETPMMDKYDISSVLAFGSGSSPLPASTAVNIMQRTNRGIGEGYGLTETCAPIAVNGRGGYKVGATGRVLPYVELKIVDVETGEMLGENAEGEVCVRGPAIMIGYVGNPEATSKTIDEEGWLHTGDLGYFDDEEFLFLTDRMKDLIKVKGFQVSPSELEKIILTEKGVAEAAVVGVQNDRTGEAPRAYVVPRPGVALDGEYLQKKVAEQVAPYKQLSGGVQFVAWLPKNHLGKVVKKKLKTDPPPPPNPVSKL
ncbi:luciferin 4-monooxygenase-like isoform X2 [Oratosquilla oratoria]|uniref:luciferin 4-monooxygenase-like isoform X2 n=1 Tax=Oratosquilla oratoria TaxID=337810 RepID=UPI003F75A09C